MQAPIVAYPSFSEVENNFFNLQTNMNASGLGVVYTQNQDGEEV